MNRTLRSLSGLLLGLTALASCAGPQYVEAAVEGFAADAQRLEQAQTFRYGGNLDGEYALRDLALFQDLALEFEARGLRRVEGDSADLHVHVQAHMDETTIVVPAHYEMGRRFAPGYWRTTFVRGSDGNLHPQPVYCPGGWESTPYRVPASTIPAYAHHLKVSVHDPADQLLWQGTIDVIDRSRDLYRLLRLFLPELADEFPGPSGKGLERRVLRDEGQSTDFDSSS